MVRLLVSPFSFRAEFSGKDGRLPPRKDLGNDENNVEEVEYLSPRLDSSVETVLRTTGLLLIELVPASSVERTQPGFGASRFPSLSFSPPGKTGIDVALILFLSSVRRA